MGRRRKALRKQPRQTPILLVFCRSVGNLTFRRNSMAEQEEAAKKNKKVNRMSLQEVTDALKKTEEHMKGNTSQYARALIARKAELEAK